MMEDERTGQAQPEQAPAPASQEPKSIGLDFSATSKETIELFVLESNRMRPEIVKLLLDHPNTPDEVRRQAAQTLNMPVPRSENLALARRREAEQRAREIQEQRLVKRVQKLTVSEKIKLAMKGGSEIRGILSRDTNKLVILAVLDNPKITDPEVEAMARSRSILEDALRVIAKNREWSKNPAIQYALVHNPKTPPGISVRYVPYMKKRDLKLLEKNKNVSDAVRVAAKKFLRTGRS
jgi:hypothetical protein